MNINNFSNVATKLYHDDVLYDEILPSITKMFGTFRASNYIGTRDEKRINDALNEIANIKELINKFIDKQVELLIDEKS